ncbi:MAG: 4-alpha-glucanotransferase [Oscillospiraceae bacterium]|nr:4-alpha-glucanotransferase [Oscillospiraceae bacterium]
MRASGILMHISSLPSPYGIGTMGAGAYRFADFLHEAGQRYWQILPLGPTGLGDSPYQSCSTHAGNPYFIDPDLLVEDGLLLPQEAAEVANAVRGERVDYGFQYMTRLDLLKKAFRRGRDRFAREIDDFRAAQPWVDDYALFMAVKRSRDMASWATWPEEIRLRKPGAVQTYATALADEIHFFRFVQFLFFRQWNALHEYCASLGIEIIGDLPIYVPYDSCDVWTNPELFQLDEEGRPTAVAGVPPDCFTEDGQLWGNPLYDWEKMRADGFRWWCDRVRSAAGLYDVIRIDHFRGLESYWSVPYGDETARNGKWVKGPDKDFIRTLQREFPNLKLIAEDLGFLTPEVTELLELSGYPGMKILEFAFDPREPSDYLPHRYVRNCICYSGTHDNETLVKWFEGQGEDVLSYACEYLGVTDRKELIWAILRAGMASIADTFIAQLQDYLELGAEGRMNEPGTFGFPNWTWRVDETALTPTLAKKIARLTKLYER